MNRTNYRIKFFCRSFDLKLYRLSKGLYESWGYPCVRLTDQTADGYFFTMLRDEDCDIAINVDEDCFITHPEAVFSLVDYVFDNNIANAGCSDGGSWCPRGANPIITNPFFNVFNLKLIRELFSKQAVRTFNYSQHKDEMVESYPKEMLYKERSWNFDMTDYEPYCSFFLWLAKNFKTYYLHSAVHQDKTTTILMNHKGEEMCRHTWFARFYSVPAFIVRHWQPNAGAQQQRIDNVINEAYTMQHLEKPVFKTKDKCQFVWNKIVRWCIKVPQRISRWPYKLKKKLRKRFGRH
ncbi:MAG: hypothetical protein J5644_04930 [Bacteroidales bacterium]|nr:hypothetical protein [Bacteroidales bacterium]